MIGPLNFMPAGDGGNAITIGGGNFGFALRQLKRKKKQQVSF